MDDKTQEQLKKNLLETLAQTEGERAETILKKEANRLQPIIEQSTDFVAVKEALETLDIFVFRVSEEAVKIIGVLLRGIGDRQISCDSLLQKRLADNKIKPTLILKALQALEKIRYHRPDEVLDLALLYSVYPDETVSKEAISVLVKSAKFDINIFYAGENRWGLGSQPQERILAALKKLSKKAKSLYASAILSVCRELLSGEMEGIESDYQTMSISRGAVPADPEIIQMRRGALELLAEIYNFEDSDLGRKQVLSAMHEATRGTHGVRYPEGYQAMIDADTVWFLQFLESIIGTAPLEFLESREDDVYRLYHRTKSKKVKAAALKIKSVLDANNEFQIFKTLIGFEGVFYDWDGPATQLERHSEVQDLRESRAKFFVDQIKSNNFKAWESRIKKFASIESNDMATFPIFGKFLEYLGEQKPKFSRHLLESGDTNLERFFVPLLVGYWKADEAGVKELLDTWIKGNRHLFQVGRFIQFNPSLDEALLASFAAQTFKTKDPGALRTITSIVATHFEKHPEIIHSYFVPTVKLLTETKDVRWIWDFWYRHERKQILGKLSKKEALIVLQNLVHANQVEHHLEETIVGIAEKYPELILKFFKERIDIEKVVKEERSAEEERSDYEAIPYQLYSLNTSLAKHPELVVQGVRSWFKRDNTWFRFREARFLHSIFNPGEVGFISALVKLASTGDTEDSYFVAYVLTNYTGEESLKPVFLALIENGPSEEDRFMTNIYIALQNAGVVSGEFGMAEAYEKKVKYVKSWLNSDSEKVKKFATDFVDSLSKTAIHERKRSKTSLDLRKLKYGTLKKDKDS